VSLPLKAALPTNPSEGVRMPFGVHKGDRLDTIPLSYLRWLASLDLRAPLSDAVTKELSQRQTALAKTAGPICTVGPHLVAPRAKTKRSPKDTRLIKAGWLRSDLGCYSQWFDATAKRPGWCCYQVSAGLACTVQNYLDQAKAVAKKRRSV
jgi:hypothetical protein